MDKYDQEQTDHKPLTGLADDDCPQYFPPPDTDRQMVQNLGRASAGVGYQEGLIHALRHVLEHCTITLNLGQHHFDTDIKALLAHVEEHGELPRGAKEGE
jgi:hypothetical protein